MRFFNTEGPVRPHKHYAIEPLERMDVDELLGLIQAERYFVLCAPRQTGKTSTLIALRDLLNSGKTGNFRCVKVNVKAAVGHAAQDDREESMRAILSSLANSARLLGDGYLDDVWPGVLAKAGADTALLEVLTRWCSSNPTPLVLLVDEIDSLVGDVLLSVLRQLRAGHRGRPHAFPQSVVLCGLRDIKDYRIRSTPGEVITGGSPFNIVAKSLRLENFTETQTRALMARHTEETGQHFTPTAVHAVWAQTGGQPWLVNALCTAACFHNEAGRDRSRTIEKEDIDAAREELLMSCGTHLDRLTHELGKEEVRRVLAPILSGNRAQYDAHDLNYVRDLGLIDRGQPPRIANPIFADLVSQELGDILQEA